MSIFEGHTTFDGTRFEGNAAFGAVDVRSAFVMADAWFGAVPSFIQAHFAEAPLLDELRIEPIRFRPKSWDSAKHWFKGNTARAARWRALKRLAIQGHDHERELEYFKAELKTRRGNPDKPWHGVFWFGLFYQLFSDFGRSLLRPLLWWAAGIFGFAGLYLDRHLSLAGNSLSGLGWAFNRLTGGQVPPLSCIVGPDQPLVAALLLSLRKGLVFAGLESGIKLN